MRLGAQSVPWWYSVGIQFSVRTNAIANFCSPEGAAPLTTQAVPSWFLMPWCSLYSEYSEYLYLVPGTPVRPISYVWYTELQILLLYKVPVHVEYTAGPAFGIRHTWTSSLYACLCSMHTTVRMHMSFTSYCTYSRQTTDGPWTKPPSPQPAASKYILYIVHVPDLLYDYTTIRLHSMYAYQVSYASMPHTLEL